MVLEESRIRLAVTGTGVTHQSPLPFRFQSVSSQPGPISLPIMWEGVRKRIRYIYTRMPFYSEKIHTPRLISITYESPICTSIEHRYDFPMTLDRRKRVFTQFTYFQNGCRPGRQSWQKRRHPFRSRPNKMNNIFLFFPLHRGKYVKVTRNDCKTAYAVATLHFISQPVIFRRH